jgi:hypothetical protein
VLIGVGSRRRSAGQAIDLPNDRGVNLGRLFTFALRTFSRVVMKGRRVFLVEDESMIRMMVADMLEELGHMIAAEAGHLDRAMELARSAEFDRAPRP